MKKKKLLNYFLLVSVLADNMIILTIFLHYNFFSPPTLVSELTGEIMTKVLSPPFNKMDSKLAEVGSNISSLHRSHEDTRNYIKQWFVDNTVHLTIL